MRSDFAVFILTHGRADNVVTYRMLKRSNYAGKIYFIIDDEDEQGDLYKKNFGAENVIVFNKQEAYDRADTMDNFNIHSAIIYARNESFRIAKELGLKYFLMLDDDYREIDFRYAEEGKMRAKVMLEFCQGGDFVGGLDGGNFHKGLLRKAMNSFFCRSETPIEYRGTMNEDVVTYTTESSRGRLFLSVTNTCVIQLPSQSLNGGMTGTYLDGGTYLKSFYAVMSMPSCVKVQVLSTKHRRIHHRIDWERCAPKILNEKWKKGGSES